MPKSCPSRPPLPLLLLFSSLFLLHLHHWAFDSNPTDVQTEEETVRRSLKNAGVIDHSSHTIPLQHCPCTRWSVLANKVLQNFCPGHSQASHPTLKESRSCPAAPAPATRGLEEATRRLLLSPFMVRPTQVSTRRRSTGAGSRRTWLWWKLCMGRAGA